MLQQDAGDDYVICSGVSRTVRELVATAFAVVDLDPDAHVVVDPEFVRPQRPGAARRRPVQGAQRNSAGSRGPASRT